MKNILEKNEASSIGDMGSKRQRQKKLENVLGICLVCFGFTFYLL
jgi:hypothetical protein